MRGIRGGAEGWVCVRIRGETFVAEVAEGACVCLALM